MIVSTAVVAMAALLTALALGDRDRAATPPPVRFTVAVPQSRVVGNEQIALAPDGER